jgi:hypothetical protein
MLEVLTDKLFAGISQVFGSPSPGQEYLPWIFETNHVNVPYAWKRPHSVLISYKDRLYYCLCRGKDGGVVTYKVTMISFGATPESSEERVLSCFIPAYVANSQDSSPMTWLRRTPMEYLDKVKGSRSALFKEVAARETGAVSTSPGRAKKSRPCVAFPVYDKWMYLFLEGCVQYRDLLLFRPPLRFSERWAILIMPDGLREVSGVALQRGSLVLRRAVVVNMQEVTATATDVLQEMQEDLFFAGE